MVITAGIMVVMAMTPMLALITVLRIAPLMVVATTSIMVDQIIALVIITAP